MLGNVMEWCEDWYAPSLPMPQVDPVGSPTGNDKVIRGGAYDAPASRVRVDVTYYGQPGQSSPQVGFRLVRTAR